VSVQSYWEKCLFCPKKTVYFVMETKNIA